MLPFAVVAATSSTGSLSPSAEAAPAPAEAPPTGPDQLTAPHRLRSGIVIGLTLGAGAVGASGYPNDVSKIGDRNFYSASGWMVGSSESLFVMGALADYLSFGFWYAHASAESGGWRSTGDGGGLRVEAFPLVSVSPQLGGVGLLAEFGVGGGNLSSKKPGLPSAQGTQSIAAAGVFSEWSVARLLGGHLAVGPSLEFDAIFSQPFERHGLLASARAVFYGGP